uniref:Transferrin receptor protein 1 n=1 Tax=Leptobrachium leishanense TaxID=445787 RepID=A0A8C5MSQ9_9ANUR
MYHFGRVPLSYTRFSLTPQTDGDSSQVEMKLADDEECGEQTMVEHVVKPRKGHNNCKNLCFKILGISLLFLIGFLIGYLSYRSRAACALSNKDDGHSNAGTDEISTDANDTEEADTPEESNTLYWNDLKGMWAEKTKDVSLNDNIRKWSENIHEAGSENEENAAFLMHEELRKLSLDKVWNDEHYVRLQVAGSSSNRITIVKNNGQEEVISPTAYVAYSPAADIAGSLVYCNYGRKEDFQIVSEKSVNVTGSLVLVRSGLISIAEKVKNAELAKAVGVLIYPEPTDFTFPEAQPETINSPFGHAHFGTGDPYTTGFPSFNHTQFPPTESAGLPKIPVQTVSSDDGKKLLELLDGAQCPSDWKVSCMLGPQLKEAKSVKLDVTNVLAEKKIYNIFGVLQGFDEPDRYVIVGAQRDAWGPGVAKAAVGSAVLLELARTLTDLVKNDRYRPRRSIVFASWGAGEFGSVGATEWLEGYLTTLHLKAIAYVNLDSAIQGSGTFRVSASPLMYSLIKSTLSDVKDTVSPTATLFKPLIDIDEDDDSKWATSIVAPSLDDAAYPFLAYSGIPTVSFSFHKENKQYAYLGTDRDTMENFMSLVNVPLVCRAVMEFAGQIILRLTHDHKLPLDYDSYNYKLLRFSLELSRKSIILKEMDLGITWFSSARGDFRRAADTLTQEFTHSDFEDKPMLRYLNDRIMKVEHCFLSPYVSPKETPFRHVIYGSGKHTFTAMMENLNLRENNPTLFDKDLFKEQLALFTWTIQEAANALSGEIWDIDNEF